GGGGMGEGGPGGGRADGGGDGGARRKAEPRHAREEIAAKVLLAAEEMRAAADVEQNAVGRIDGDERRVALAAVGNGVEKAGVGRPVLGHGRESWVHGGGLRRRGAGGGSELLRRGVDRQQEIEVAALAEDDEGRRRLTPLPCDAVGRKPIQPQAQNALRARNAAPHCST